MGNGNYAMVLPANYPTEWDGSKGNTNKGMYISVLLRIIDATPNAGVQPKEKQRYPYRDLVQGTDALKDGIPRVYLAVNKSGIVSTRLYKKEEGGIYNEKDQNYYTDAACTVPYTLKTEEEIKEFGWAAVPVTGKNLEIGKIYTYTLDYTIGVGVHDQEVTTSAPKAGDPIISDQVRFHISVRDWKNEPINFEVPGN